MTKTFAMAALVAALTTATASFALAQSVPEGQSCGGILCDMGVFGHKVAPPPKAPPPAALAPHAETVSVAEPEPEPKKVAHKRKRVAKATPSVAVTKPAAPQVAKSAPTRAIASLPMPDGWKTQTSAVTADTTPAPVKEAAQPVPVKAPERSNVVASRPSQILDPFSTIPSRAAFRPLY